LSDDFTVITTDIKIWKKKYQLAYEEIQRLKTVLIAANTDILSWKTKAENLYIEYNKSLQINIQNTNTINQYTTLLTNLRQEITNLRIQINTATSESGEWKKQYETEVKRSASLLINIQNLEITIAEWVSKNDKANADLGVCLSKTHDNDLEISDLKDEVNVLLNVKSSLTIEISNCNVRYETCVAEFDEDEKQDLLDLAALEETKLQLGECNARADELDIKYQSEKAHAILLGEEIIQVRGECQLKYNQYDIQISELNISFQGRLDECNAELDIERNTIVNINIDITNLRNELVDIKNQLTISLQVSQDWESKNLQCEGSLVLLNETIVVLRNTIDTTNSQLTECAENDLKLQENLNTCNADLALSEENLTAAENDVNDRDITIEGLLSDISDLTNDNNTCNNELGELRCSINQFLPSIVEAENNIKQKLLDVTALFDDNGNNILGFAGGHNLDCPSCDGSVPCITNQAA
jgi:chromosome segregation ATPase